MVYVFGMAFFINCFNIFLRGDKINSYIYTYSNFLYSLIWFFLSIYINY